MSMGAPDLEFMPVGHAKRILRSLAADDSASAAAGEARSAWQGRSGNRGKARRLRFPTLPEAGLYLRYCLE